MLSEAGQHARIIFEEASKKQLDYKKGVENRE